MNNEKYPFEDTLDGYLKLVKALPTWVEVLVILAIIVGSCWYWSVSPIEILISAFFTVIALVIASPFILCALAFVLVAFAIVLFPYGLIVYAIIFLVWAIVTIMSIMLADLDRKYPNLFGRFLASQEISARTAAQYALVAMLLSFGYMLGVRNGPETDYGWARPICIASYVAFCFAFYHIRDAKARLEDLREKGG